MFLAILVNDAVNVKVCRIIFSREYIFTVEKYLDLAGEKVTVEKFLEFASKKNG